MKKKGKVRKGSTVLLLVLNAFVISFLTTVFGIERVYYFLSNCSTVTLVVLVLIIGTSELVLYATLWLIVEEKEKKIECNDRVREVFLHNYILEVYPVSSQCKVHEDFFLNLKDIAKFYALLNKERGKITILVKFGFEDFERRLETIDAKNFAKCYKIIDKKVK